MQVDPVVWLGLGGALSVFVSGRWTIGLAGWLAPLLLLHYAHAVAFWPALLGVWAAVALGMGLSHWRIVPVPGLAYPFTIAAMTAPIVLPYLADRWLAPALPGFTATLVFPLAWTVTEHLGARLNPFGTWGALAYTQAGNLPLLQFASVAGLWGIVFVMAWFASVVAWAGERGFDWQIAGGGVLAYAAILAAVLVFGRLRLNRAPASVRTVRIATVGWPEGILDMPQMLRVFAPDLTAAERAALRAAFARILEHFLAKTAAAARAGARIVVWPEANVMVFGAEQAALVARLQALAKDQSLYLLAGVAVLESGAPRSFENKALLFDPAGALAASYTKTTVVPGFEAKYAVRGDGRLPTVDTPYGRLTAAICYDLDFPWLLRQAGRMRAELLLVPASDWREIGEPHHVAAVFRAVENGVSLVRATRWGLSAAATATGRVLARSDHFTSSERIMIAEVPIQRRWALYTHVGDGFAWLCLAGMLALAFWVVLRGLAPG